MLWQTEESPPEPASGASIGTPGQPGPWFVEPPRDVAPPCPAGAVPPVCCFGMKVPPVELTTLPPNPLPSSSSLHAAAPNTAQTASAAPKTSGRRGRSELRLAGVLLGSDTSFAPLLTR